MGPRRSIRTGMCATTIPRMSLSRFPLSGHGAGSCAVTLAAAALIAGAAPVSAQGDASGGELPDGGIPVASDLVHRVCGDCHPADEQGRMSRISYQRTSPEGWQQTIRRMVLLNDLQIEPTDAREAVRYLATHHGLAPEEARLGAFEVERRNIDFFYEADPETQETCNRCHSMGRVLNQRRTLEEWELLTAMHRGYYPFADFQSFTRNVDSRGEGPDGGDDADERTAVERAVAHLAEAFPLDTTEWTSWSANMRTPVLDGTWALVGHERGQGPVYGTLTVASDPSAPDELDTRTSYRYPSRDVEVTRTGQALIYTGYQWRGRSTSPGQFEAREVMFLSRDREEITGRWFTGGYDERGIDVTLRRVGSEPLITGVYPRSVPSRAGDVTLQLFGANLPQPLDAASIDLGAGLTVTAVSEPSATSATLAVTVDAEARIGARDLFIGSASLTAAVTVFDEIHRLDVTPATGLARVGGIVFPKQYEYFEARAWHDGPDGESGTDDDLDLGMVDVDWSVEEYAVTYDDDDTAFVGTLGEDGAFEPAVDGPNPERSGNRNNVGDVWVVATLAAEPVSGVELERPLRARAHLLVTVPVYLRRGESGP
ncbi:MAG: quinohemoprotein amine dehydrogenase subunit alpha [Acidobacteria bacterium]|nr:quinohemoprotein amine dehydrogenase subunit alpha [Acidobacteriota bacterium]